MPPCCGPAADMWQTVADKWQTVADGARESGGHFTSQREARLTACKGWRFVDWPAVCGVASDVPQEVTHLAVGYPTAAAGASTSGWRARPCKDKRCIVKDGTHIARTSMCTANILHVEARQHGSMDIQFRTLSPTLAARSLKDSLLALEPLRHTVKLTAGGESVQNTHNASSVSPSRPATRYQLPQRLF